MGLPGRLLSLTTSVSPAYVRFPTKKTFLFVPLGWAKFVERSSFSHDVDSQNLRLLSTRGGRFCADENFSDFFKQKAVLLKRPSFMPERPRRGSFLRPKFQSAISSPGFARLLGRFENLTAGQRSPASRLTNTSVLPSAHPPRRGFRSSAELRFLNRLRGRARHPSAHNPRKITRVHKNFLRCAQKPCFFGDFASGACFPGSECAL